MVNFDDIKYGSAQVNKVYSGADLVWEKITDTTAPITTARPIAGTYIEAQTVFLDVNEVGNTYYTTNGTTPTINSTKYTAGITINATTTLNYFTVDLAGNVESVKTSVYTIQSTGNVRYIKFQGYGDNLSSYTRLIELKAIEQTTNTNLLYQKTPISGETPTLGTGVNRATDNGIAMTSGTFPVWSGEGVPTLVYDLGELKNVTQLQMYMFSTTADVRQTQFKLWISTDNITWKLVADYSGNTTGQSQTLGWRFDLDVNPSTPTNFIAQTGVDQVSLSWTVVPNAANYTIYRSDVQGQLGTAISTNQSATKYLDVIEASTQYYTLRANNYFGYTDSAQITGISGADGLFTRYLKVEGYSTSYAGDLASGISSAIEFEAFNNETNLLLNKLPISYDTTRTNSVANITDGSKDSQNWVNWDGPVPNMNLIYDLGEEPFEKITKMIYTSYSVSNDIRVNRFKILSSLTNNGIDWSTIWDMSATNIDQPLLPGGYEFYTTIKWRYFKFQGFGDRYDEITNLIELEVYEGENNILLERLPISGETPDTGNVANVTDGIKTNELGDNPQWINTTGQPTLIYDFGQEYNVSKIVATMFQGPSRTPLFKLWLSADNINWTLVADYSSNEEPSPFTFNLNYWTNPDVIEPY